jgi:hypothetical protein
MAGKANPTGNHIHAHKPPVAIFQSNINATHAFLNYMSPRRPLARNLLSSYLTRPLIASAAN